MKKVLAMILLATLTLSACRTEKTQEVPETEPAFSVQATFPTEEQQLPEITEPKETILEAEPTEPTVAEPTEQETLATEATTPKQAQAAEYHPEQETIPSEPIPEPTTEKAAQPQPTQPAETSPAETEPPVSGTVPVEAEPPAETAPIETTPLLEEINTDALASYGISYACSTYGYESCPGLRDGFYPSYTCEFTTMEVGFIAVQGCVDDTTNTLLSRPGVQIVTEINGVLCRARIDVTVTQTSPGVFEIAVYYG